MFQLVFTVEDSFDVPDKGTVITGVTHDDSLRITAGATVSLRRPGLTELVEQAVSFEVFPNCFSPEKPRNFALLLPESVGAANVPRHSEVWADIGGMPSNNSLERTRER
jgi:hypothetical protein